MVRLLTKKIIPVFSILFLICFVSSCFDNSTPSEPEEKEKYTVTFNSNGGSNVDSVIVEEGNTVSKPNNPTYEGYNFVCWNHNDVEFDFTTPINSNITLVASWEEIVVEPTTYTVTFDSNGGTSVDSEVVEEGSTVTRPTDPEKTGFVFIGWLLNGEVYDFATLVNENVILVANWEKEIVYYTVTFDTDGGSSVDAQEVEEGTTVTKPTDPEKENYTFVCWMNGEVEFDFTTPITDDITLVASWKEKSGIEVGEEPDDENGQYGDIIWG